jgi:hypothetical protein
VDFEISGSTYRAEKISALKQFHVMRRLLPLLSGLAPALKIAREAKDGGTDVMLKMLEPMADILAKMSDEDSDYVIKTCLTGCYKQQGGAFAPITARDGQIMFQDIDMPTMLQITVKAIQENFGGFFTAPAQPSRVEGQSTG